MPALPIAEQVAGLEPAIAANSAQANTLAMPRPPGTRLHPRVHRGVEILPARERPIAAPLRMNSGIDSSVMLAISS